MAHIPATEMGEKTELELRERAAEMRSELADISEKRMQGDDAAWTEFRNEAELIDRHLDLIDMQSVRSGRTPGQGAGLPTGAVSNFAAQEYRSPGQLVADDEGFRKWCGENFNRGTLDRPSPTVELRTLVQEGTFAANSSTDGGVLAPVNQPYLVGINQQRLFVRDLITVQPTGLAAVHYVRATKSPTSIGASTVPEGGTKPETSVTFVGDIAPMQVIAANIPITTQILEDVVTVVGYINGRLVYELKLEEESQIINGTGTSSDLKGIRAYTGSGEMQSQSYDSVSAVTTLAAAIGKVEAANGFADGVAINPTNYWAMVSARASTSGVLDAGTPFSSPPLNVWGLPAVRTNSLASGKAMVANWSLGATLFDRKQAGVRVYEQHSDFAAKNKVLLQAEERVGLAVNRPDWFVYTSVA